MTFEKLFMKAILPVLMLGAALGINFLILPIILILPYNYFIFGLYLALSAAIIVGAVEVYHKLYRNWLSTKQDELKKILRQRANAKGSKIEENLDITLKCMEANGILIDC